MDLEEFIQQRTTENGFGWFFDKENGFGWLFDKENGFGRLITEDGLGQLLDLGTRFLGLGNGQLGVNLMNTSSMIVLQMMIITIFGVVFGFLQVATNNLLTVFGFLQMVNIDFLIRIFPFAVSYIDEMEIFPEIE